MQSELSSMICETGELGKTSRLELVLVRQSSSGRTDDSDRSGNIKMQLTFERLLELLARILTNPEMLSDDLPVPTLRSNGHSDPATVDDESGRITPRQTAVDLDAGRCEPRRLFVLVGMYMLQQSDLDWTDGSREYEMMVRRADETDETAA